jgi:hypothetical protein
MTRFAIFNLSAILPLAACGDRLKCGDDAQCDGPIERVEVESDHLVVELAEGPELYQLTCMTDVVALAVLDGSGGETPLATDHAAVADRYEGYWLDGVFLYPSFDEGCDVVECRPIDRDPEIGRIAFAVTGSDSPPDDLQSHIDSFGVNEEAAEEVAVVEGTLIEGSILVSLTYHLDDQCQDAESTSSVIVDL